MSQKVKLFTVILFVTSKSFMNFGDQEDQLCEL
jgi:hypothetical protein